MPDDNPGPPVFLRILLAEDDASSRLLFRHYLKSTPHRVDEAHTGAEAVERAREGAYDLIFLDLHMPEMGGDEAAARIRAWEREQGLAPRPLVMMSATDRLEGEGVAAAAGCSGFLVKPWNKGDILEAIRSLCGGQRPEG